MMRSPAPSLTSVPPIARLVAVRGSATPEEAARGDVPARYVRVVGVVVRGDQAIVAQLMNDRAPFEVETAQCSLERDGTWDEDSSGNSLGGFLPTGDGIGTFVAWDEAPPWAVAARFVCREREQVVAVDNGCAFAVFDDVRFADEVERLFDGPQLSAWIDEAGKERTVERHEAPAWMREHMRSRLERIHERRAGQSTLIERWRRHKPEA
jgi:hypothetical protein